MAHTFCACCITTISMFVHVTSSKSIQISKVIFPQMIDFLVAQQPPMLGAVLIFQFVINRQNKSLFHKSVPINSRFPVWKFS